MLGKPTRGDVLRINITPQSTSFPWVRIFRYARGVRGGAAEKIHPGVNATHDKDETARAIGLAIIESSEVLKKWCR